MAISFEQMFRDLHRHRREREMKQSEADKKKYEELFGQANQALNESGIGKYLSGIQAVNVFGLSSAMESCPDPAPAIDPAKHMEVVELARQKDAHIGHLEAKLARVEQKKNIAEAVFREVAWLDAAIRSFLKETLDTTSVHSHYERCKAGLQALDKLHQLDLGNRDGSTPANQAPDPAAVEGGTPADGRDRQAGWPYGVAGGQLPGPSAGPADGAPWVAVRSFLPERLSDADLVRLTTGPGDPNVEKPAKPVVKKYSGYKPKFNF